MADMNNRFNHRPFLLGQMILLEMTSLHPALGNPVSVRDFRAVLGVATKIPLGIS
jgi:hypothetical protein